MRERSGISTLDPAAQPVALTHGFYRFTQAEFTPDGRHLLLLAALDSVRHPDRALENAVFLADRDGRHPRRLLGQDSTTYATPAVSPLGRWLAFQQSPTGRVAVPTLAKRIDQLLRTYEFFERYLHTKPVAAR